MKKDWKTPTGIMVIIFLVIAWALYGTQTKQETEFERLSRKIDEDMVEYERMERELFSHDSEKKTYKIEVRIAYL